MFNTSKSAKLQKALADRTMRRLDAIDVAWTLEARMFPALTFTVYRASQNVTAFTSMARGEKPQAPRLLAKKPIMMLRRWQVASAAAAKPGEAMARHKAVKPVPPSQGQQPRNPRNAPWETQAFSHSY